MFRKNEEARTQWSPENVEMCAARQDEILDCAAGMLKEGGRLVYSTCTLNPAENEAVVERFLAEHPDFAPAAPPRTYINGQDGLDCDGFFTAPLQRREEVSP